MSLPATSDSQPVTSTLRVSVVIPTHNPREDYLARVIDALRQQTLPREQWELLVVDNASKEMLDGRLDLSWHANARIVREEELGLTPARLRGIREATGELLVFVDDDNVLDADYLEQACRIAEEFPHVGAWGGSCRGEFEVPLPDWAKPYLTGLVVNEIDRDYWSNLKTWSLASPYGAGLCLRRRVADEFVSQTRANPALMRLDRQGRQLLSGGDTAMANCAIDCGMGTGRFARLRLSHLIAKERLTADYIVKLYVGFHISSQLTGEEVARPPASWSQRLRAVYGSLWRWWHATPIERKIMKAVRRAGYNVQ